MVKASLTAACTLCIAAVAGTASAQGFHGATLALEYNDTTSSDYGTYSLEGRLAYDITSNFGVHRRDFYDALSNTQEGAVCALVGLQPCTRAIQQYHGAGSAQIGLYEGQCNWDFIYI